MKIEVGKTYLNGFEQVKHIVKQTSSCCFVASCEETYLPDGTKLECCQTQYDLVSEYIDPRLEKAIDALEDISQQRTEDCSVKCLLRRTIAINALKEIKGE